MINKNIQNKIEQLCWEPALPSYWQGIIENRTQIVFLAPPLDTVPSPSGNAIYTIIQDLALRSPEPSLVLTVYPQDSPPEICDISDRILYCKDPFKPILFEDYLPYRLKKIIWGTGRPELITYAKKAAQICNLLQPKAIVIEDVPLFGYVLLKRLNYSARIILHQHNNAPLSYPLLWWKRMRKSFDRIIFVAKRTWEDTENKHGLLENATVVYNGVNLKHYNPENWEGEVNTLRSKFGITKDEIIVLYVGRIIPGKGCFELAQAFLQAAVLDSKLFFIGNLETKDENRKAYIANLQLLERNTNRNIRLVGKVPQSEIPAWYKLADILVVPSIQHEGLPKVVTEALAMGKPVLASERGGTMELIRPGENGWLLKDPEDIEAFSILLRSILIDREKIRLLGENAMNFDRPKLSIEQSAKRFFDTILE